MKKIIIVALCALPFFAQAQNVVREDFDSNTLGWNEISSKRYSAIIQDGVLHLETREKADFAIASCYDLIDVRNPFEISIKIVNTKIDDEERGIGIVFNYLDDFNFDAFTLSKEEVRYQRFYENKLVGQRSGEIKFDKKQKDHELVIKSGYNRLEFFVNGVKAIDMRNIPLTYSGFGLIVWSADGKYAADIDYIEFKQ